jgi:hypothetical protein
MSILDDVQEAIRAGRALYTDHGIEEMQNDKLTKVEVAAITLVGEIIEDYPTAYPLPACLVLGFLDDGSPVHTVWAFANATKYASLVTVYRPDPARWSADFRKRVKP